MNEFEDLVGRLRVEQHDRSYITDRFQTNMRELIGALEELFTPGGWRDTSS